MIRYLTDQILAAIQRRCEHPDEMVAVDILEGCSADTEIGYCRRCGAVRITWKRVNEARTEWEWRRPDPNLWGGYRAP